MPFLTNGVAFSADSLPISDEGGAFSAAFQANGVAFSTTGTGVGCISSEGVAFSTPDGPACVHLYDWLET